jgi:phosphonate transport system permease protein
MSRLFNLLLMLAIGAAVIASFNYLAIDLGALSSADSLRQMASYVQRFLQPDVSQAHLSAIAHGALETLAMSALGTLLAAVLGLLLALPAAGRFGGPLQGVARLLLNALRAIPELVWAALMVLAAGLGPNAGTLALALHTAGVLGRLFSATAPCPTSGRSSWHTASIVGKTTSAWPACSVLSAPVAWGRCSTSTSACFRKRRPAR